jgi:hypothetical protein
MKSRTGMVLVTALGSLLAAIMVTPANAASAPPARFGDGLVAERGVIAVGDRVSPNGAATAAVIQSQLYCYVGVRAPKLEADRRLTETWWMDCRNPANPSQPATDIQSVYMQVRIYNGSPYAWEPGTMVGGTECTRNPPKPECSATTYQPIQFGLSYYTRLDVTVTFIGGATQYRCFVTDPIRFV